jgi:hypothetical protein
MRAYRGVAFSYLLLSACFLNAQSDKPGTPASEAARADDSLIPTTPLEYGDPILITKLSKTDGISGAFRCGADGSALFMLYRDDQWQDATGHPRGHIALASAAPDGKLTSIPWQTVPGYKNIDVPKSYFASHDRYYVLTSAEKETAAGTHPVPTRIPLALVFDQTGSLKDVAPLDPTLNPISIAAFGSGDILLVSEDTLNRRMRLSVVDSAGNKLRDIKLEDDDDPSRHHGPNAEGSKGGVTISPHALIGMTEVNPYGQNLLLVPLATSGLPILEIDESHVVRSVVPHLPKGNIIARFIPSDGRTWNIRLGGAERFSVRSTRCRRTGERSRRDGIQDTCRSRPRRRPHNAQAGLKSVWYLSRLPRAGRVYISHARQGCRTGVGESRREVISRLTGVAIMHLPQSVKESLARSFPRQ